MNETSMNLRKDQFVIVVALLLAFLFLYTAFSKVLDPVGTLQALKNQVFPVWMAEILFYTLPIAEVSTTFLLMTDKWRIAGLKSSVVLMAIFTGYILLVLTGIFSRVPCSCGGVLNSLGWGEHLVFNLAVLGLAVLGVKMDQGK
ncbi:MauE/DoxX family redox-associated membrane protein [Aquiflexum sp.]|uniref:MauE/DoxX family redox-associated membrane protein n=1 Tax=Aquiflexum sp. TaxID=1872584 RepID=UPI0035930165